jgi:hypothetical protein
VFAEAKCLRREGIDGCQMSVGGVESTTVTITVTVCLVSGFTIDNDREGLQ